MRLIDADMLRHRLGVTDGGEQIFYVKSDDIDAAPTVEAEPVRRGRWVPLEPEIGFYECSECQGRILRAVCFYCPNCGAKMDKEENEGET